MRNLDFPLDFTFKITSIANDFVARDAQGQIIAYVREKIFRLKDEVDVYGDLHKSQLLFRIKANKWLDWSASYKITNGNGESLGRVGRKGWQSLWNANYNIFDANDRKEFEIREDKPFVKIVDSLLGGIPVLNMLSGYFFNPGYTVKDPSGVKVAHLQKQASFWGRRFRLERSETTVPLSAVQQERIVLSLMMMVLLERRRG